MMHIRSRHALSFSCTALYTCFCLSHWSVASFWLLLQTLYFSAKYFMALNNQPWCTKQLQQQKTGTLP